MKRTGKDLSWRHEFVLDLLGVPQIPLSLQTDRLILMTGDIMKIQMLHLGRSLGGVSFRIHLKWMDLPEPMDSKRYSTRPNPDDFEQSFWRDYVTQFR
jgi:hypothetical protein